MPDCLDESWCLYATSGDCSEGAMSDSADCIVIDGVPLSLITDFLRAQSEWQISVLEHTVHKNNSHFGSKEYENLVAASQALREIGVFQHKYHQRTEWELREFEDGQPLNKHIAKFNVIYPDLKITDDFQRKL